MQVELYLAGETTQVIDSIPWVRCASGNVFLKGVIQLGRDTIFRMLMQIDKQHFLNSPEQGEIRPSWINRFRQFSITNSILTMIAWFSTGVLVWKPHCSFHNVQCVLCRGTWGCFRYTFQPSCHSWHQLLESCFHCHFYNPRQSPSHLSKRKTLLDLCYICPRGTREGMPYFVFEKSVFVKHTSVHSRVVRGDINFEILRDPLDFLFLIGPYGPYLIEFSFENGSFLLTKALFWVSQDFKVDITADHPSAHPWGWQRQFFFHFCLFYHFFIGFNGQRDWKSGNVKKSGPEKVRILHKSSEFHYYSSLEPVVRNAKFWSGGRSTAWCGRKTRKTISSRSRWVLRWWMFVNIDPSWQEWT